MRELGNWYSRGYLPHFDEPGTEQIVTYRLADALPEDVRRKIEEQVFLGAPASRRIDLRKAGQRPALPGASVGSAAGRRRDALQAYLDAGHGCCALRDPSCAAVVMENWRRFDGEHYRLLAWVVMPNHVHVLVRVLPGQSLCGLVQSWKSYTAKKLLALVEREVFPQRQVWQREYWDRFIRDEAHRIAAIRYIHENPVKAGLVTRAEDWPWSSAFERSDPGSTGGPPAPVIE